MTTPDDSYPEAWRPKDAPAFPEQPEADTKVEPLAMVLHAAAMDDTQWADFVKQARGGRA